MRHSLNTQLSEYASIGVQTGVEEASPHRLILMLLDGALEKLSTAEGCLRRGEVSGKGENISWAISIVGGLQGSLNLDEGGEIASNLDDLYNYMTRRLMEANVENDVTKLAEVATLLNNIRDGWKGIAQKIEKID